MYTEEDCEDLQIDYYYILKIYSTEQVGKLVHFNGRTYCLAVARRFSHINSHDIEYLTPLENKQLMIVTVFKNEINQRVRNFKY